MITPLLEKAIAKGDAAYSKFTHAFGMFGSLKIPNGKTIIIVDIKWNQFINPYQNLGSVTMADFFRYNEYQLKIDGNKSINYMHFRNAWKMDRYETAAMAYNTTATTFFSGAMRPYIQPERPIIQDVFFICEEFINITISRNIFINDYPGTVYGLLQPVANQKPAPNGVGNVPVLLNLVMRDVATDTMNYVPAKNINAGVTAPINRNMESYTQDIAQLSQIYDPSTGFNASIGFPYLTNPLVEFGLVIINTNKWNDLINS